MESFGEIISKLLVRHNCVVLPNFGGFVARVSAAQIDEVKGIISPPRKAILFNQQLTNSDGLLVSEYALANNVTYTEAQATICGIIDLWNDELQSGKRIGIERVGELYLDIHGRLSFVQDRYFNLLLSSYGLGTVKFIPTNEKTLEKVEETTSFNAEKSLVEQMEDKVDLNLLDHQVKIKSINWKYVAAAACILPIAFYSFWIPTKTTVLESGMVSIHDFNPFEKTKPAQYKQVDQQIRIDKIDQEKTLEDQINELPSDTYAYSYEFDESLYIPIKLKEKPSTEFLSKQTPAVQQPLVVQHSPEPIIITQNNSIQFAGVKSGLKYAIVGCFSEITNAKTYVETLKKEGFDAQFLDVKNGLYRISIDSSTSADSLQQTIQKALAKGYNTWILK